MTAHTPTHRVAAVIAAATAALLLAACGSNRPGTTYSTSDDPGQEPITVASDSSAESRVVAALYERLLTDAGKKVQPATASYNTPGDAAKAVVTGAAGLTPAYESNLLRTFDSGQREAGDMAATLSMALPIGFDALPPAAAQRGVVLAVSRASAQRFGLLSIADLAREPGPLTLGGTAAEDPDAPSPAQLATAYGITLTAAQPSGTPDVLVLRSSDPLIAQDHLVVLTDPESVIPPEHVFPLINSLHADKTTTTALARLDAVLTTDQLTWLATQVGGDESPSQAAASWLRTEGLAR